MLACDDRIATHGDRSDRLAVAVTFGVFVVWVNLNTHLVATLAKLCSIVISSGGLKHQQIAIHVEGVNLADLGVGTTFVVFGEVHTHAVVSHQLVFCDPLSDTFTGDFQFEVRPINGIAGDPIADFGRIFAKAVATFAG